jgi:cysteine-rich repeat protein
MVRDQEEGVFRSHSLGTISALLVIAAVASGSCWQNTKTSLCASADGASVVRCPPGWICSADHQGCIRDNKCGDTVREEGEICDDGNTLDGDGCSADCLSREVCGDLVINEVIGELCDDGNNRNGDGCSSVCKLEFCGDSIVSKDRGEVCDDGNADSFDGCRGDCKSNEACGNGLLDGHLGEKCEFPDAPFPRAFDDVAECDNDCTLPTCGDGHANRMYLVIGMGPDHYEQCDNGTADSPACDSDCTGVQCGDSHANLTAGEQCDTAGNSLMCDSDCTAPMCGDGHRNQYFDPPGAVAFEECDAGGDSASCDADCTIVACGDHYRNLLANEECDDSNNSNNDDCPNGPGGTCKIAFCGDGHMRTQGANLEQCDNGSSNRNDVADACRTDCRMAFCGDGVVDAGEMCDPGGSYGNGPVGCAGSYVCASAGVDRCKCI